MKRKRTRWDIGPKAIGDATHRFTVTHFYRVVSDLGYSHTDACAASDEKRLGLLQDSLQNIQVCLGDGANAVRLSIMADPGNHLIDALRLQRRIGGIGGNILWNGSRQLVAHLHRHADKYNLVGASAVELGAGLGLLGMAVSKLGADLVTMTDLPALLPLMRHNIASNFVENGCLGKGPVVRSLELDWCRCNAAVATEVWSAKQSRRAESHNRWIFGADVLYDKCLIEPLATTLCILSACANKCRIMLALSNQSISGVDHGQENFDQLDGYLASRSIVRDRHAEEVVHNDRDVHDTTIRIYCYLPQDPNETSQSVPR